MAITTPKPHVVLLASPGMGHLVPLLELANRLVSHHNPTATLFTTLLDNSPSPFDSDDLLRHPLVDVILLPATASSADPTATILSQVCSMVRSTLPLLRSALDLLCNKQRHQLIITALIVDIFGMDAFQTADELGMKMKKYVFCTSNAWFLAQTLYVPTLDEEIMPDEEMRIPGCKPIRYDDLLDPVWAWGKPDYAHYSRMGSDMATADGILVNTWQDLEPTTVGVLTSNKLFNKTPVHPIGPVTRPVDKRNIIISGKWSGLLAWVDEQSVGSVLSVSFGSGGTLSADQTSVKPTCMDLLQFLRDQVAIVLSCRL